MAADANANARKRVLFVDDEVDYLSLLQQLMALWSKETWDIYTADNTGKAFSILQEHAIDLVVTDRNMPVVDGIQFIRLLHRKYPDLAKVVLSGDTTETNRQSCIAAGADLFLAKPTSMDGMESVYGALNELIKLQSKEGFHGVLRQVSLQDLIQLECLKGNSSVLVVSADAMRGKVFIKEGHIVHAQLGDKTGEPAFNALLALKGGEFGLKPFAEPPEESIQASWESLLMEAARVADEGDGTVSAPAPNRPGGKKAAAKRPAAAPAPAAKPAASASRQTFPTKIEELLICSPGGEVLHEWQCPNVEERMQLLEALDQKSKFLAQTLRLGVADRLELQGPKGRAVAQWTTEARVLVRSAKEIKAAPTRKAS